MNESCWKGYKQIGMKKKGGRTVPNCVKENKFSFAEWLNENKETDNEFFSSLVNDAKNWIPLSDREAKEFWQNETDLVDRWNITEPEELHKVKLEIPLDHIQKLKNYDDSIVDFYNSFDIWLKNKYKMDVVDFIDYDSGVVYLIKPIKHGI